MSANATGTPTTNFSVPKFNTASDAPNGRGVNEMMDALDTLLAKGFAVLTTTGDIAYASAANTASRLAIGSAGQRLATVGGIPAWKTPTSAATTSGSPAGTASLAMVMLGVGGISFTPTFSGTMLLAFTGSASNTLAGNGVTFQLAYGTGAAPGNGTAATGNAVGSAPRLIIVGANSPVGAAHTYVVSGFTLGTTYWLDMQFAAISGGTASLGQVNLVAIEV